MLEIETETETVQATVTAVYSARSLLKTRSTSSSSWETTGTLGRSGWGAARSRTFSTENKCRLRGNKHKINLMNLCKYSRNSNKTIEQDDGLRGILRVQCNPRRRRTHWDNLHKILSLVDYMAKYASNTT